MNPFRSPKTLSYLAMVGITLQGLCHLISLFIGLAMLYLPPKNITLDSGESANAWVLGIALVAIVQLPAYIFTVVVFLMWINRVYKNLGPLHADPVDFTPGWAVGWWFIPFANLVKPFQVVRDAWIASDPELPAEGGIFTQVRGGAPAFMAAWWGLWIASNIVSNFSSAMLDDKVLADGSTTGVFLIGEGVFWLLACGFAMKVVMSITSRQELRSQLVQTRIIEPPPPPTFETGPGRRVE